MPLSDSASVIIVVSAAGVGGDLSNAKAFPVPFKGNSGDPGITFTGLVAGTHIRLFTMRGRLVQTLDSPNGADVLWDVKNAISIAWPADCIYMLLKAPARKKKVKWS